MTDDIISASGLSAHKIPPWQKVFWCCTEGLVAVALVANFDKDGTQHLKSLQAVSIIIGLPFTGLLCMMVPSLYRIIKKEAGDEDIVTWKRFNTQLLDILELFNPKKPSPYKPTEHLKYLLTSLFVPFVPVKKGFQNAFPNSPLFSVGIAVCAQALLLAWIIFMICEVEEKDLYVLGWLCYISLVSIVAFCRIVTRDFFKVWGSPVDDATAALFLYPFALSQIQMMVDSDGQDAPLYFDDADALIAKMKELSSENDGVKKTDTHLADVNVVEKETA